MLKPSAFILALFALFSTSVLAQDLRVCPNVQVGEYVYGANSVSAVLTPVIYSDCSIEPAGGGNSDHVVLAFDTPLVGLGIVAAPIFGTTPVGDVPLGVANGLDFVVEDMGPNYSGTCSDMAASIPTLSFANPSLVDGNVYCGRLSNIEGNQVWLRGTADVAGNTWKDPIVLTNQPGVGTPYSPASPASTVPVPVLPFWGLLSLAGLIGLFGFRKLRA